MGTMYVGNRSYFTDDTGVWDSEHKKVQYDSVTLQEIKPEEMDTHTVSDPKTTATVTEVSGEPYFCKACGFIAKSYAGLQVHKFKKHMLEQTQE